MRRTRTTKAFACLPRWHESSYFVFIRQFLFCHKEKSFVAKESIGAKIFLMLRLLNVYSDFVNQASNFVPVVKRWLTCILKQSPKTHKAESCLQNLVHMQWMMQPRLEIVLWFTACRSRHQHNCRFQFVRGYMPHTFLNFDWNIRPS